MASKSIFRGVFQFVKNIPPGDLPKWTEVLKGEPGYAERRQLKLANPVNEAERLLRASRYAARKAQTGKTPKAFAAENYSKKTQAERDMYALKRRETADKKQKYKGEPIKDIKWFEKFKAERVRLRESIDPERKGELVGGSHEPEDYERGKAFAEKHADVEADFLQYVESPPKKGSKKGSRNRRKLDAKGRNNRDMMRGARKVTRNSQRKTKAA